MGARPPPSIPPPVHLPPPSIPPPSRAASIPLPRLRGRTGGGPLSRQRKRRAKPRQAAARAGGGRKAGKQRHRIPLSPLAGRGRVRGPAVRPAGEAPSGGRASRGTLTQPLPPGGRGVFTGAGASFYSPALPPPSISPPPLAGEDGWGAVFAPAEAAGGAPHHKNPAKIPPKGLHSACLFSIYPSETRAKPRGSEAMTWM